jgi:hypothetical protein
MRIKASGYGAGGRETPGSPTCCACWWARRSEREETEQAGRIHRRDRDGHRRLHSAVARYVSELLLAAGAWDVYRVAVQMKKGRTGVQVTVLCRPDLVARCAISLPRDHHHRPALEARKQILPGARIRQGETNGAKSASRSPAGPTAKLPTPRRSMRIAAAWPRSTRFRSNRSCRKPCASIAAGARQRSV